MTDNKLNESLVGHRKLEQFCLNQWQQDRLPQTLLLAGLSGVGKATFAYRLARFILSGGAGGGMFGPDDLHIDATHPVFQQVAQGSHGDLLVIEPELSGQSKTPVTKVDAIRKITHFLHHTSATTSHRIVIVDGMEVLNPQAANALLKAIEEPPSQALFLLITTSPSAVLPTIRSRTQLLRFQPLNREDFNKVLAQMAEDMTPERLEFFYLLSEGSPGKASYYEHHQADEGYAQLLNALQGRASFYDWLVKRDTEVQLVLLRNLLHFLLSRLGQYGAGALREPFFYSENAAFPPLYARASMPQWLDRLSQADGYISAAQGLHLERKQTIHQVMQSMSA